VINIVLKVLEPLKQQKRSTRRGRVNLLRHQIGLGLDLEAAKVIEYRKYPTWHKSLRAQEGRLENIRIGQSAMADCPENNFQRHCIIREHSLNTLVSDLMSLTNAILEHAQLLERMPYTHPSSENYTEATAKPSPPLIRLVIMELLKMMAPITPAFSEECWAMTRGIKLKTILFLSWLGSYFHQTVLYRILDSSPSIFNEPFPTKDRIFEMLASDTQICAI
jgi:hypothetical protein